MWQAESALQDPKKHNWKQTKGTLFKESIYTRTIWLIWLWVIGSSFYFNQVCCIFLTQQFILLVQSGTGNCDRRERTSCNNGAIHAWVRPNWQSNEALLPPAETAHCCTCAPPVPARQKRMEKRLGADLHAEAAEGGLKELVLSWFQETQAPQMMSDGNFPVWFQGLAPRK